MTQNFDEFVRHAWRDHQDRAEAVAGRLADGLRLITKQDQIPLLAQLIVHVMGEHLGRWGDGLELLQGLKSLPVYAENTEAAGSVARSKAAFELGAGFDEAADGLPLSDRVRALAMAASALAGRKDPGGASRLFSQALSLAEKDLTPEDPANRALAVTGNNMACALEDLPKRSAAEIGLMVMAAVAARKYWEIAGSWLEIERAEYRLAMSKLKAGEAHEAREHARACLRICDENEADALEKFFGHEALCLAEKASGDRAAANAEVSRMTELLEKISPEHQAWCKPALEKAARD